MFVLQVIVCVCGVQCVQVYVCVCENYCKNRRQTNKSGACSLRAKATEIAAAADGFVVMMPPAGVTRRERVV